MIAKILNEPFFHWRSILGVFRVVFGRCVFSHIKSPDQKSARQLGFRDESLTTYSWTLFWLEPILWNKFIGNL